MRIQESTRRNNQFIIGANFRVLIPNNDKTFEQAVEVAIELRLPVNLAQCVGVHDFKGMIRARAEDALKDFFGVVWVFAPICCIIGIGGGGGFVIKIAIEVDPCFGLEAPRGRCDWDVSVWRLGARF
jgi:hypothetical protein